MHIRVESFSSVYICYYSLMMANDNEAKTHSCHSYDSTVVCSINSFINCMNSHFIKVTLHLKKYELPIHNHTSYGKESL